MITPDYVMDIRITSEAEFYGLTRYLQSEGYESIEHRGTIENKDDSVLSIHPNGALDLTSPSIDERLGHMWDCTATQILRDGLERHLPQHQWKGSVCGRPALVKDDGTVILQEDEHALYFDPEVIENLADESRKARGLDLKKKLQEIDERTKDDGSLRKVHAELAKMRGKLAEMCGKDPYEEE